MRTECTHLLASSEKCQAPAVSGSSLCRHHHPRNGAESHTPFSLPPFSDRSSLLFAISEVLHATSERRIKRSDAGTLLFGLQLASKVMSDIDNDVEKALASGESDNLGEPFRAESPCDRAREPRGEDHMVMKSVEALLRNMQTVFIEPVFDSCQPKRLAPARKSRSEILHSVPGAPR